MRYSPSTRGFYDEAIDYPNLPTDLVDVSQADYLALLQGQTQGKMIAPGPTGAPELQDPPPPTAEEIAAFALRKRDLLLATADAIVNMLEDGGESASAWRQYRQALRGIPNQAGFPTSIDWPTAPQAPQ